MLVHIGDGSANASFYLEKMLKAIPIMVKLSITMVTIHRPTWKSFKQNPISTIQVTVLLLMLTLSKQTVQQ